MNPIERQACNPSQIAQFLSGELQLDEKSELESHLEHCERCQQSIEQAAADHSYWMEARQFLDSAADNEIHTQPADSTSLLVQTVLQSLAPSDDPDRLGRLGPYEVTGVIGFGGMGVVLKAIDGSLDRTVAIKVLSPHLATVGASRKRFAREAKAAAAVIHPNVIAIHAVSNNGPLPYLVMPFVRGASLRKRLDLEGPLPVEDTLRIGAQIASGLSAAHQQGLVHRDIKPANILLEDGVERVAITDFGLARAVDDATMTRSGVIAGTPQYMSPEQARGDFVDARSDLFSLGSVLYSLCTGRSPFRAPTSFGVLRRITDTEPRSIREINPVVPEWLCQIVKDLHAKCPDDRIQSAEHLAKLLTDCLAHIQNPPSQLPVELKQSTRSVSKKPTPRSPRFSLGIWTLVAAATLAVGIFGFRFYSEQFDTEIPGSEFNVTEARELNSSKLNSSKTTNRQWGDEESQQLDRIDQDTEALLDELK